MRTQEKNKKPGPNANMRPGSAREALTKKISAQNAGSKSKEKTEPGARTCVQAQPGGDPPGNRTPDTLIKSQVLYRLS